MSLLVIYEEPILLLEHHNGQISTFPTPGSPHAQIISDARQLPQIIERRLRLALRKVSIPSCSADQTGVVNLFAPHAGRAQVTIALPPPNATNRNKWWNDLHISGTHVATLHPSCDIQSLDGRLVRKGALLGSYETPRVYQPGQVSGLPLDPGGQLDLSAAAPRLVDLTFRKMRQRANAQAAAECEHVGDLNPNLFRWVLANGRSELRDARLQALKAFPILSALMRVHGPNALDFASPAIDNGNELRPLLEAQFETSGSVMQMAARLRPGNIGRKRFDLLASGALRAASRLSPDHIPGRGAVSWNRQWRIYLDIFDIIRTERGQLLAMEIFTVGGPIWTRLNAGQAKSLHPRIARVIDCLDAAYHDLLLPNLAALKRERGQSLDLQSAHVALGYAEAGQILRDGRGFSPLEQVAKQWEREAANIQCAAPRFGSQLVEWPPLSQPYPDPETGLIVLLLTSTTDLQEEGKAQEHCVALYADQCLFTPAHIVSIRDALGQRLSTAQLYLSETSGNPEIKIVQHFGARNSEPSASAEATLRAYLERIVDGLIPVAWDRLETNLEQRIAEKEKLEEPGFSYDVADQTALDTVFEAWRFILPAKWQRLTRTEWIHAINLARYLKD